MSPAPAAASAENSMALPAIGWGGLTAGILDITVAFIRWGDPPGILKGIASGLLGPQAFHGGWGIAALVRPRAALSDRVFRSHCLLRGQPQAYFPDAEGGGLGFSLWHRGLHVHELGGHPALGLAQEQGSILPYRAGAQSTYAYVLRRIAHRSCGAPLLAITGKHFHQVPYRYRRGRSGKILINTIPATNPPTCAQKATPPWVSL